MPTQPTPSLSFLPSHSPPHFHVYRLSLMVCILTISVWKPTDSPALWARQGRRFIWEGGVAYNVSSHGTSLQYFSLVMELRSRWTATSTLQVRLFFECTTQLQQLKWVTSTGKVKNVQVGTIFNSWPREYFLGRGRVNIFCKHCINVI